MKKEEKEMLDGLMTIKITDSESVILKKKMFIEYWEKLTKIKPSRDDLRPFSEVMTLNLTKLLSMAIFREQNSWFLKQQRIKNYMLYIENQAFFSSKTEKIELRVKWKACKRWLRACEETGRDDIPPPIELLRG